MEDLDFLDLEEGCGDNGFNKIHCLVGKILHSKTLNKNAVSSILKKAWSTRGEFSITPWNDNTFLFRFKDEMDRTSVMRDGPWSVMGNLLVLKPIEEGVVVSTMNFNVSPFWVQIHGLPVEKMTKANAETIGNRLGRLLGIEAISDGLLLERSFLRVRVELNLSQPLPKGFWLRRKEPSGFDLWIAYKYERLTDFCYACGRVGHENRNCKYVSREDGINSGYGPELRTGSIRGPGFPVVDMELKVDSPYQNRRPVVTERETRARDRESSPPRDDPSRGKDNSTGTEGGVRLPHSTNSLGTDVTHGRAPGNSVPPLLLDVPSSLPTLNIPTLDVTNPIFPRRMQIHSLNDSLYSDPISDGPHYFVTEPNDSPKHPSGPPLSPKVSGLTHTPWPTLSNIPLSPKASPTHSHEDISLSNVFGRILSLKRKSDADPNSTTKSKALKLNNHSHLPIIPLSQPLLVATIPSHPLVSNPIPDPTHKLPPKRITPRKRISKPKPSLSHEYLEGGSNLVEIQVALDDKIGVGIDYDMDQRSAEDGAISNASYKEGVVVADPQQPHAQC